MTTRPTEEDRIQFLTSLKGAIEAVTQRLESTENNLAKTESAVTDVSVKLTNTTDTVNSLSTLWTASIERHEKLISEANESVRFISKQLNEFKEETDRFKQYSKGIDENLEGRFTNFKERLENLNRTLEILETGIKGIRDADLVRINEKIRELPNIESIRQELSNSTSPLASKSDLNSLALKVSNIEGAVNSHFRNNLIGLFIALATIIGTNVVAYYTFVSKIDSARLSPIQNAPSSPATSNPTNTATPSPSPTTSTP